MDRIIYDSTESQFLNSEKYCRNINLYQQIPVTANRLKYLKKQAEVLNKLGDGDMACFILRKNNDNEK